MTALDLTQLAAACEARAKAGEKPVYQWDKDGDEWWHLHQEMIVLAVECICDGGWVLRRREGHGWIRFVPGNPVLSSLPAAQLFAESLLAEATAPLHADKAVLMQTIRERDRMIGEMDERTRVCDTEQGRRIVEQLDRIAALEAALAEAQAKPPF